MKKEEEENLWSGTFTWRIYRFSKLRSHWQNRQEEHLSLDLDVPDASTLPSGRSRYAKYSFTVVHRLDSNKSIKKDSSGEFVAENKSWGFKSFMPLSELHDPDKGYLVNDLCIVEVEVSVRNGINILDDQESDELLDFRGLVRIERTFVPLLEEVCSSYPSLIECFKKRSASRTFVQSALTALGRLLHFLKATKVKDTTPDACKRLQLLWEELEIFKFNLGWLEPHIQSVLVMNKRAGRVNRQNDIRRRRAMLAASEADLQVAKRDLAEAEEECFNKIDMDSELGYPLA
ncbi:MATH domain and coiled-coil domain-containing protein [Pyrus ussuriensis x Pyrus communis]|uniref:MATH domain and coiled-coil domain-containing protein n=1 Tax=Pyrus ussuriensis x Pyrus communis TaxID=2448454 RepID=A0A5N5HGY8_9ROSA|nr:MATH domain and coiled-coil domain-containing protein [Pyrus ussuriensis x Pyrus communis]